VLPAQFEKFSRLAELEYLFAAQQNPATGTCSHLQYFITYIQPISVPLCKSMFLNQYAFLKYLNLITI